MLQFQDFIDDEPWVQEVPDFAEVYIPEQIEGVRLRRLITHPDARGDLTVLMSTLDSHAAPPPHIYLVRAMPGSVRAWVFHRLQSDRLAFTNGSIRVVLYDIRPESPTYGKLNILDLGSENPIQLTIPPLVIHGVQNRGAEVASFVNMPTRAYSPTDPDKARLAANHHGVPYSFG